MSAIELNSFRTDLIRWFPNAPVLARLPIHKPENERRIMSRIAHGWDAADVPKEHPVPFNVLMQRKLFRPAKDFALPVLAKAKVVADLIGVFAASKLPIPDGPGGGASGPTENGKERPEYTGRTVAEDDPYHPEIRYTFELSDAVKEVEGQPSSDETMERFAQALFSHIEQRGPVLGYKDADQVANQIIIHGDVNFNGGINVGSNSIDASNSGQERDRRPSWRKIGAAIILAISISANLATTASFAYEHLNGGTQVEATNPTATLSDQTEQTGFPNEENSTDDGPYPLDFFDGSPIEIVAVNTESGLVVRERPDPGAEQIGSFMQGDRGTLVAQKGEYVNVRYFGEAGVQISGWVLAQHISAVK